MVPNSTRRDYRRAGGLGATKKKTSIGKRYYLPSGRRGQPSKPGGFGTADASGGHTHQLITKSSWGEGEKIGTDRRGTGWQDMTTERCYDLIDGFAPRPPFFFSKKNFFSSFFFFSIHKHFCLFFIPFFFYGWGWAPHLPFLVSITT